MLPLLILALPPCLFLAAEEGPATVALPHRGQRPNPCWPAGGPTGTTTFAQYWTIDPAAAPSGVSASNGLQGTTP